MIPVGIVAVGYGNIASLSSALGSLGIAHTTCSEPVQLDSVRSAIIPGVGDFADGAKKLRESGMDRALARFVATDRQVLGICLGAQLMCDSSEEDETEMGLGFVPGTVRFLTGTARSGPHQNWETLNVPEAAPSSPIAGFDGCYVYYSHSLAVDVSEKVQILATSTYGNDSFIAAFRFGNLIGMQFHPEKSGVDGLRLLNSVLNAPRISEI